MNWIMLIMIELLLFLCKLKPQLVCIVLIVVFNLKSVQQYLSEQISIRYRYFQASRISQEIYASYNSFSYW